MSCLSVLSSKIVHLNTARILVVSGILMACNLIRRRSTIIRLLLYLSSALTCLLIARHPSLFSSNACLKVLSMDLSVLQTRTASAGSFLQEKIACFIIVVTTSTHKDVVVVVVVHIKTLIDVDVEVD